VIWLLLEAGVALLLLVFIIWWTLPSKKKDQEMHGSSGNGPETGRHQRDAADDD
jgi:hypothetical protein